MDSIKIEGMEFFAYHGALPEENKLGQRFILDVSLFLDLSRAGKNDSLEDTINYAEVYEKIKAIVEGKCFFTIEALGEAVAAMLKEDYPLLQKSHITVHKPQAPVAGIFKDISITLER